MFHHCAFAWKTMKERPFAWRVVYPKRYHHSSSSFLTIFPQKCQAKDHDGSGQKFLSTSDSIWPQLMAALVIIMVCKLGGTSSISAEKFVNPWKISIMSKPIITNVSFVVEFLPWWVKIFLFLAKNQQTQGNYFVLWKDRICTCRPKIVHNFRKWKSERLKPISK